jgi:hypothetical protein
VVDDVLDSVVIIFKAMHARIELQIIPTTAHPTKRYFGFSSQKLQNRKRVKLNIY